MQTHSTPQPSALKVCSRCGEAKPLSEFYQRKSGRYDSPCRTCYAARYQAQFAADPEFRAKRNNKTRQWRENNRDHIAAYNAARYDQEPELMRAAEKASEKRHPERISARKAVRYAVTSGKFPPASTQVCEMCQEALASHYHHHKGYAKEYRLEVVALCTECHGKAHWV